MNLQTIERIVAGELKSCIEAHGPVTKPLIGSACKRILGGIKSYVMSLALQQIVETGQEEVIGRLRRQVEELKRARCSLGEMK